MEEFSAAQVQKATLNILEDFELEKQNSERTQRATFNILEDFELEKNNVENTQRATLNLLDDLDEEKRRVERAERELNRRATELGRSNADLERFAHVVSHDLQEPLRTVTGYMQLLEGALEESANTSADEYLAKALAGAVRMREMIEDLLTYSRAGRKDLEMIHLDLEETLAVSVANMAASIGEAAGQIDHDPLPSVTGDATLMAQVFQNLISNAIKFHGDTPPRVHIEALKVPGAWQITVADNGIGISQSDLGRLFIPFQRLQSSAGRSGSGIGLSTCRRIVERHGGRMWVDSTIGSGSNFRFTIPDRSTP